MAEAYDPLTLGRSGFSQDYDAMPLPRESRADDTGDGLNQTLPDRKCYTCQPCRSFSGLIGSGTSPAIPPDVRASERQTSSAVGLCALRTMRLMST